MSAGATMVDANVQLETFKIEQWKKIGELEATMRTTYPAAMLQDSDDVVVSTIMAPADADKPHPKTKLYLS